MLINSSIEELSLEEESSIEPSKDGAFRNSMGTQGTEENENESKMFINELLTEII